MWCSSQNFAKNFFSEAFRRFPEIKGRSDTTYRRIYQEAGENVGIV